MVSRASVQLSAGDFSYLEGGVGPPVLFLHALGRSASDWLPIIEALENEWRCIALDQRGHGHSVHTGEYRFGLLEGDFREFVDSLGIDRFNLVAHSMGGVVGLLFAEKTAERLRSLILEDTTVPMNRHEYPDVPPSPDEQVDYDWEARRQLFRELSSPDPTWWTALRQITTPTLLIAGRRFDRDLEETAESLQDVHMVTIEAGHWIHETESEPFLEAVREFLERQTTDS